ncbi:MAG TPA: transaldolase [Gaiellales bacterium]|jgi:transaldolase|nr:transaldolase [Gaiellales bacterium]
MSNPLLAIRALGQSIWLDNISRELLDSGKLAHLIAEDGISGVTSNPTIFEKAIGHSDLYDRGLIAAARDGLDARRVFFRLAYADIRDGADLLRPAYEEAGGQDGNISFELPPELARDVEGSIEAGQRFRDEIDRVNVLIKVPATAEGVDAFRELTAAGVSVNVTLLFAVQRYEEIANAWIDGLERRVAAGQPIDRMASVASFFVSRVDTKVDARLEELGRQDLQGMAAVANAKLAYRSFQHIFSGPRWDALVAKGAHVQRPLWASTSVKNPSYPDTLYVDTLIGPDTVNTMPEQTIESVRNHGVAKRTIDTKVDLAEAHMQELARVGVDLDRILLHELVDEGVESFAKSFDSLIATIDEKARALAPA